MGCVALTIVKPSYARFFFFDDDKPVTENENANGGPHAFYLHISVFYEYISPNLIQSLLMKPAKHSRNVECLEKN